MKKKIFWETAMLSNFYLDKIQISYSCWEKLQVKGASLTSCYKTGM